MRKKFKICMMFLLIMMIFTAGCRTKDSGNAQYNNGNWTERYVNVTDEINEGNIASVRVVLSVNIYKDMSEADFIEILDYYEDTYNSSYSSDNDDLGERDGDYTCYAVFYRNDTDEVITKIKYCNRDLVPFTEEEEYYFPKPELRSGRLSN